jgi:hypothetical protein
MTDAEYYEVYCRHCDAPAQYLAHRPSHDLQALRKHLIRVWMDWSICKMRRHYSQLSRIHITALKQYCTLSQVYSFKTLLLCMKIEYWPALHCKQNICDMTSNWNINIIENNWNIRTWSLPVQEDSDNNMNHARSTNQSQ